MILAIDIGNSWIKAGLFNGTRIVYLTSCPRGSKSTYRRLLSKIKSSVESSTINAAGISSVVRGENSYWAKIIKTKLKIKPVFISGKSALPIKIKVKNPSRLGADRICNAVAAYEIFKRKQNVIAVDLGTAITYDIVLRNGNYLGGIIAPGIGMSAYALNVRTSRLPLLKTNRDFFFPRQPLGENTLKAMRSGIMFSLLYSVEGIIHLIQTSLRKKFQIVLTGGNAKTIYKKIKFKTFPVENLVLHGINYILTSKC